MRADPPAAAGAGRAPFQVIDVLLVTAGMLACGAALLAESLALIGGCALCLLAYVFLLHRDLRALRLLFAAEAGGGRRGRAAAVPATEIGERVHECAQAMRFRVHTLENAVDVEQRLRKLEAARPLAGGVEEPAQLYTRLLDFTAANLRCAACAILLEGPGGKPAEILARGVEGGRFRQALLRIAPLCAAEDGGAQDERVQQSLAAFGIGSMISFPLRWEESGDQRRALLWAGYREASGISVHERRVAAELARRIETELKSQRVVCELRGRVREEESRNQQKSEFIVQLSHDIRSPLSNISSILTLFKLGGAGDDSAEMIDTALKNCESAAELLEDMLDLSKFSAGKLGARREPVELPPCIEHVIEAHAVSAKLKGLTLQVRRSPGPCYVLADRRHLKRIVGNLLSNAVKYTQQGGIEVSIERQGEDCVLQVRDSGLGMTPEQVSQLFSPFTRFHENAAEGVGLGLALTKILTELNGGAVQVQSRPGQGSQFTLTFPALTPRVTVTDARDEMRSAEVLIVDDDPGCVSTLARILKAKGWQVYEAFGLAQAIAVLDARRPRVLITDGCMPGGGAKELLQHVRAQKLATTVIVISGNEGELAEALRAEGARCVLTKPVDIDQLLGVLGEAVAAPVG